jgi:hypothetical protein
MLRIQFFYRRSERTNLSQPKSIVCPEEGEVRAQRKCEIGPYLNTLVEDSLKKSTEGYRDPFARVESVRLWGNPSLTIDTVCENELWEILGIVIAKTD